MKKIILLLVLVLSCSFVSAVEQKGAQVSKAETEINPWLALVVVWMFDAADLEGLTRGYVSLGPTGILSAEKWFEKNGVELRLLGMAHVAERGFYQDIKDSLHGKPALMLMEGVSDEKKLLKTPPDLGSLADKLGAADQRERFSPKEMPDNVEIVRADLDASDFSADTVEVLNFVGQIYSKKGFDFGKLFLMYLKLSDIEVSQTFFKDVLVKRNECLIGHLKRGMEKHQLILIPWGALHLPEIEKWAADNGFSLKGQKHRIILRFPSYFQFILAMRARK